MVKYLRAFFRAFVDLFSERIFYRSASISYFALILLLPLFTIIVLVFSYLPLDSATVVSLFEHYFPGQSTRYLKVVEQIAYRRWAGGLGVVSVIASFVFASNFFVVVSNSLSDVLEVGRRKFKHQILSQIVSVPIFLLMIIIVYVLSLSLSVIKQFVKHLSLFGDLGWKMYKYLFISQLLDFLGIFLFVFYAYLFLLPKSKKRVKQILVVSIVVALLFVISKKIFTIVLMYLVRINPIYGTFGGVLSFLLWIYVSSAVILFGGRMLYYLGQNGNS